MAWPTQPIRLVLADLGRAREVMLWNKVLGLRRFVWGQIDEAKLEAFIRKHCTKETKKEWGLSD